MAAEAYYYIGAGVLHFEGKDYKQGAKLPAGLPKESIQAMLKNNKISAKVPTAASAASVDELGVLRDQVKALVAERDTARADLATVTGERDAARDSLTAVQADLDTARADLAQANKIIAEMTEAQLGGAGPLPEAPALASAAGPK